VAIVTVIGVVRHRTIAPPATLAEPTEKKETAEDLSALVAEAKREIG
jgi:hypothetical protein